MANKLSVSTPTDREVLITRVFNAPRPLVYDAWTKPALLKRWLHGLDNWTLAVCDMDVRPGGSIRWVWRGPAGEEMGLRGVYKEVVPPERLVHTELFDEDWTGGETLVTLTLTEQVGKTTCAMTVLYSSLEARDAAVKTGMTDGMELGYSRLDKLLAEMG
jgi:uncharacterized protein YndB with AHSA1/START domain